MIFSSGWKRFGVLFWSLSQSSSDSSCCVARASSLVFPYLSIGDYRPRLRSLFRMSPAWGGMRSGPGDSRLHSLIGNFCRLFKDLNEHGASQLSSLGVLVGGMVRSQQGLSVRHLVFGSVLKDVGFPARELAATLEVIEIGIKADLAQRDHNFYILQSIHFAIEIRSAVCQFLRKRLVVWRSAAYCSRNVEIFQLQPVIAFGGVRLIGETGLMQDGEHKFPRRISGERTPSAIGAVRAGSEPEDENPRIGIAESGDGLSPVLAIAISAAFLASNPFAVFHQPRTAGASDDFGVELDEP